MPYSSNKDLPKGVKNYLPKEAQDIFREVFNKAWGNHGDLPKEQREETCFKIAWSVIKKSYHKKGDEWIKNTSLMMLDGPYS